MPTNHPIAVLGMRSEASYAVANYLDARFPGCMFVFERPEPRALFLKRRIKKLGFIHVLAQIGFQLLVTPLLKKNSARRVQDIRTQYGLSTSAPDPGRSFDVLSMNEAEALHLIEKLKPAAVVLAGTRILSKQLLASLTCPIVNIHAGITPLYRGVHGAYWALAEGRRDLCGVTVHRVDVGIDTGEVLAQTLIDPTSQDNFVTYPWLQMAKGLQLLTNLIPSIIEGRATTSQPLVSESKLRSHPTIWAYLSRRIFNKVQ